MYNRNDWTRAITKLTRLTINGEVKWDQIGNISSEEVEVIDRCFKAVVNDKGYIVYSGKERYWVDEDEFHWSRVFGFEIWHADQFGNLNERIAVSPDLSATANLFQAVEGRYAVDQNALGFLLDDDT